MIATRRNAPNTRRGLSRVKPLRAALTRIASFALPTLALTLFPLICTSVVSHTAGVNAFLALSLGQAVGGFSAIAVMRGWDVDGPQALGQADPNSQTQLLNYSMRARTRAFLILAPVTAAIAVIIAPDGFEALTALQCLVVTSQGLSPVWWFAGLGKVGGLYRYEVLPRSGAAAVCGTAIISGARPEIYPIVTAILVGSSYLVCFRAHGSLPDTKAPRPAPGRQSAQAISLSFAVYNNLSLPIVQTLAGPLISSQFASGLRLYNYSAIGTSTSANALVSTIHTARKTAVLFLCAQSIVIGALLVALGPWLSHRLFAVSDVPALALVPFSIGFFLNGVNTGLSRFVVIPSVGARTLAPSYVSASAVGICCTIYLAIMYPTFAAFGIVSAELVILLGTLNILTQRR